MDENNAPVRVLKELSTASLTRAIEESLAAFPLILARLPGAEIYDTPDLLWISTGVPIDSFNGVFRSILDPQRADTQIEEIMQEFRRRQLPMLWQLGPSSQPLDLRQRLLAHGFTHEEDEPGMAVDLLAMNEEFSTPAGLDIRLVDNMSTLHTWVAVWGFGVPGDTIPLFQDVHAQLGLGPPSSLSLLPRHLPGETNRDRSPVLRSRCCSIAFGRNVAGSALQRHWDRHDPCRTARGPSRGIPGSHPDGISLWSAHLSSRRLSGILYDQQVHKDLIGTRCIIMVSCL
jgi:hypothetical protein